MASRTTGSLALLVLALGMLLDPRPACADPDSARTPLFVRVAAGPAFDYETWRPSGGSPGSSYTGWGPSLDVAVGVAVRPALVVAGDVQLTGIVDRTESYLGSSYPLSDTLHLLAKLGALVDYTFPAHPRFHVGGGLAALAVTDVDTHMGGAQTGWGLAVSLDGGINRPVSPHWSVGALARLSIDWFWTDLPAPASRSIGFAPTLMLSFTRR